ncbi:MAG: autotransporter-associated beta strand repeat-containing protein [Verrucomicrobia bacterium]|nr:autotransporter-associated beta strand repeat-containing protein [Verrucomicrobiota bacterium]
MSATYADGQTVQFTDTANAGSVNLSANVAPAGVLVTNNALNYTLGSATGKGITGTTGLNKQGPGTLTLSGLTNSYSGITTIGGGTVAINADNNLGAGGGIVLNGGALSVTANVTLNANRSLVVGPASGSGAGTLDAASGQTLTFGGVIANNLAGTGSLTKTGGGTVTLTGANTYSGSTTVNGGTLLLTAAQQNGSAITVNNGATLAVTRTGGTTLPVSGLTLGSGGATTVQFGNLSTGNAVITATNLTTSGTVTVGVLTGVPTLGEIPLIKYSGSIGGSGFSAFSLPSLPAGVTAVLTNDSANKIVGLLVQNVASYTWTGTNGTTWDAGITTNWSFLGNNVAFVQGSGVLMDDTAFTNVLNLTTTASVFNLLVTNNALNYTINGNGALSGSMTLTKTGTNTLTVANLGNNSFTGGATVQQGTLDVRVSSGPGSGAITLAGGTLENNSGTTLSLANAVVAQSNTTSILQCTAIGGEELALNGPISGSGNLIAQLTGSTLNSIFLGGDNSGFTGTLSVSNNSSMRFWFTSPNSGSANAGWVLDSAGTDNQKFTFGTGTIAFGLLAGNGQLRNDGGASTVTLRVGDLNTDSTFSGIIVANGAAQFSVLKAGTGTWTITGAETYTGNTVISNGALALSNNVVTSADGSIAGSGNISIAAGAVLDVSGRSDQNISLGAAQLLRGYGTVIGNLDTYGGGTIAPGDGRTGNTGTLTVSNTVNLGGTIWMKLNRTASPNSDRLVSPVAINYGGTLVVTNVGAALQPGDMFTLFSSPTFNGSAFGAIVLPAYQSFDTSNLGVNGTITFLGYSKPAISSVDYSTLTSGFITFNATNGLAGGPLNVLTTTNIALPVSSWTPVTTNTFDGGGNYSEVITVNPALPKQFFILKAQ